MVFSDDYNTLEGGDLIAVHMSNWRTYSNIKNLQTYVYLPNVPTWNIHLPLFARSVLIPPDRTMGFGQTFRAQNRPRSPKLFADAGVAQRFRALSRR